jgi:ribosomal protein S19E (S16A)
MDSRTHLLRIPHEGGLRVVGAVAIEAEGRAVSSPQQSFLQRIARSLFEAGDAGKTEVQTR